MVPEMPEGPAVPAMPRQWGLSRLDVNLPNVITLGRLLCVPLAIWLILGERYGLAFWVFVAAGVSDALDGWIAKRWNQRTPLGALPHWLVILVVLRDLLIVGGYLLSHGVNAPEPLFISKVNTLVQIALIGFVLARLGLGVDEELVTSFLIAAAGVTTVWSGLSYLVRWARFLVRWN